MSTGGYNRDENYRYVNDVWSDQKTGARDQEKLHFINSPPAP